MFSWLFKKKTKTIPFSEVLVQMKDKIVTSPIQCYFYNEIDREICYFDTDWQINIGEHIQVHEYYVKDNVHYRNSFVHVVE